MKKLLCLALGCLFFLTSCDSTLTTFPSGINSSVPVSLSVSKETSSKSELASSSAVSSSAPDPTSKAEPTVTIAPTPRPTATTAPSAPAITILSVSGSVAAGSNATIKAKGKPNTEYDITVYYSSGASTSKDLNPKTSDDSGAVEWTWKVGINTKPGEYRIVISGAGKNIETTFTVT